MSLPIFLVLAQQGTSFVANLALHGKDMPATTYKAAPSVWHRASLLVVTWWGGFFADGMGAPQIALVALLASCTGVMLIMRGAPKPAQQFNAAPATLHTMLLLSILWWGGFFASGGAS